MDSRQEYDRNSGLCVGVFDPFSGRFFRLRLLGDVRLIHVDFRFGSGENDLDGLKDATQNSFIRRIFIKGITR